MDSQSLERKKLSFTISDILDAKPMSLLPPQSSPSPTCNNAWQGVSNYDNTPDNRFGDCKERPGNPTVDADSPPNTEQGILSQSMCEWIWCNSGQISCQYRSQKSVNICIGP